MVALQNLGSVCWVGSSGWKSLPGWAELGVACASCKEKEVVVVGGFRSRSSVCCEVGVDDERGVVYSREDVESSKGGIVGVASS